MRNPWTITGPELILRRNLSPETIVKFDGQESKTKQLDKDRQSRDERKSWCPHKLGDENRIVALKGHISLAMMSVI
jgi:hypothetical protein